MRSFAFLALVAALLAFEHPQRPQIANAQERASEAAPKAEPHKYFWERTTDDPVALYTLVLSVFTGLLVVVTGGLIWIGWRQIELTKRLAIQQIRDTEILQRAYVSVEPDGIEPHQDRGDRVHGRVIFRNVGHLSARNVRWYGTCGVPKDFKLFPLEELFEGQLVLPPGTTARQRLGTVFTQRYTDQTPVIGNSTFVWGIVTYEDGFGKQRFTRFCHRYPTKAFIGGQAFVLGPEKAQLHDHGNDAN